MRGTVRYPGLTGGAWACPQCGLLVTSGVEHVCPPVASYAPAAPSPVQYHVAPAPDYTALLTRIAEALERICECAELESGRSIDALRHMHKCPYCGACPADSRCDCDFVGLRARKALERIAAEADAWLDDTSGSQSADNTIYTIAGIAHKILAGHGKSA